MGRLHSMAWFTVVAVTATVIGTHVSAAEVCVENATIGDVQEALRTGRTTAAQVVRAYTARIQAYDRAGPGLNAVRELNPDAPAIAAGLDAATARTPANAHRPLEGIPVLLKDNIATGD